MHQRTIASQNVTVVLGILAAALGIVSAFVNLRGPVGAQEASEKGVVKEKGGLFVRLKVRSRRCTCSFLVLRFMRDLLMGSCSDEDLTAVGVGDVDLTVAEAERIRREQLEIKNCIDKKEE